jgi:hypothetical protein
MEGARGLAFSDDGRCKAKAVTCACDCVQCLLVPVCCVGCFNARA